jgi:hypothetical protein
MNDNTPTYTREQAMTALGISSPSAFHHLRRKYPSAFVVVKPGNGRGNHTLYDKAALDGFIAWRQLTKMFNAITDDPLGIILNKKGKRS